MGTRKRIGLREVRALGPNQEIWDAAVPGFGARRRAGAAVSYVLMYRTPQGRLRRYTIGHHGAPWTPESARKRAQQLLGDVAAGNDPGAEKQGARRAITVGELLDRYWKDAQSGLVLARGGYPKKPSTLASDRGRIEGHIRPLLGHLPAAAVTRHDVEKMMEAIAAGKTATRAETAKRRGLSIVRGGRGVATRTVGLAGAIFAYAVRAGVRTDNPAHGIRKFAESRRERRVADEEYGALGEALRQADGTALWPPAIAAARFLALTGWRRGEALNLRWREIDLERRTAVLAETKTGRSLRPLPEAACGILRRAARLEGSELAFPARFGSGAMAGFHSIWARIFRASLPPDITPHTLRHSFASVAADLGYGDATIASIIGHKRAGITARYTHSADAVLLAAADVIAARLLDLMGDAVSGRPEGGSGSADDAPAADSAEEGVGAASGPKDHAGRALAPQRGARALEPERRAPPAASVEQLGARCTRRSVTRPVDHDDEPLLIAMADFISQEQPRGGKPRYGLIEQAAGHVLGLVYGRPRAAVADSEGARGAAEKTTRARLLKKWGRHEATLLGIARLRSLSLDARAGDAPLCDPARAAREGRHLARTAQRTARVAALQLGAIADIMPALFRHRDALSPSLRRLIEELARGNPPRFACDLRGAPVLLGRKRQKPRL